jgi:hypothetical protein
MIPLSLMPLSGAHCSWSTSLLIFTCPSAFPTYQNYCHFFYSQLDVNFYIVRSQIFFLFQCVIYLQTNNTKCQIPCILDECQVEHRRNFKCPIWICEEKSTTSTTSMPDPESTTFSPNPEPIPTG